MSLQDAMNNMQFGLPRGSTQNSEVSPVTVKPVDSKTLEGSYPGDHRSGQVNVPAVPQPAPRAETTANENAGA